MVYRLGVHEKKSAMYLIEQYLLKKKIQFQTQCLTGVTVGGQIPVGRGLIVLAGFVAEKQFRRRC